MNDPETSAGDPTSEAKAAAAGARRPTDGKPADTSRRDHAGRGAARNRPRRRASKEVNLRFLAVSLLLVVVVAAGLLFAHRFQKKRMAGNTLGRAEAILDEDPKRARSLLREYLHLQPKDIETRAKLARLQMEHAETVADWRQVYRTNEDVLRDDPERDGIRRAHVDVLLRMGRYHDARDHLQRLLEKDADSGELHLLRAITYEKQGEYREAVREYEKCLQDPEFQSVEIVGRQLTRIKVLAVWAEILRGKLDQPGAADALYDRMAKDYPESAEAFLLRAGYRSRNGLIGQAARDARTAMSLDPDDVEALLAAARFTLDDPRKSDADVRSVRESLSRAAAGKTADGRVYQMLFEYEMRSGDADRALAALQQGVKFSSDSGLLRWILAEQLAGRGKKAEDRLRALLEGAESSSEADTAYLEGCRFLQKGRLLSAAEHFERAGALSPNDSQRSQLARLQVARCDLALGRAEEALKEYYAVLDDDPQSISARLGIARAQLAVGRIADARRAYRELPHRDPQTALEFARLEFQLASRQSPGKRNWESFEEAVERAEDLGADPMDLALLRASALLARGETSSARDLLETARQTSPGRPEPWIALATLASRDNDWETAGHLLEQAEAELGPDPQLDVARLEFWRRTDEKNLLQHLADVEQHEPPADMDQWIGLQTVIGANYQFLGDAEGVLRAWLKVAEARTGQREDWLRVLELSLRLDRDDVAEQAMNELREIEGESGPYVRCGNAMRFIRRGERGDKSRLAEARALLEALVAMSAEETAATVRRESLSALLGKLALAEGKPADAADRFLEAIEQGNQDPGTWLTAARLLIGQQRSQEAIELLERVASAAAGGVSSVTALTTASLLSALNQQDQAIALARALVENDPNNSATRIYLGSLLAATGEAGQAADEFRKATELAPSESAGWVMLTKQLVANGEQAAALQVVKQAEQAISDEASALAFCYELVGRIDDAEQVLQTARAADPSNAALVQQSVSFYLRAGQRQQAEALLRPLLDNPAGFDDVNVPAVRRLLASVNATSAPAALEESLRLLDQNLQDDPEQVADLRLKSQLLISQGHPDSVQQGLDVYAAVERLAPLTAADHLIVARAYDRLEDGQAADRHWAALLDDEHRQPVTVAAYLRRELERGHLEGLDVWSQELQELQPTEFSTVALLSRIDIRKGNVSAALARLEAYPAAAADDAHKPARIRQVAELLAEMAVSPKLGEDLRSRLFQQAESAYHELIPLDPQAAIGYATLLAKRGELARAIETLDHVRGAVADVEIAASGVRLLDLGEHDAAAVSRVKEWVDASRRADPDSLFAVHVEEALQRIRGEYDESIRLNRLVLKQYPQNAVALNNLAWLVSAHKQQHAQALELIERAIGLVGPKPFLLDTRGLIQMELGQPEAAAADFRASWLQEKLPATRFHWARALEAAGDREAAKHHLAAAVLAGLKSDDIEADEVPEFNRLREELGVE